MKHLLLATLAAVSIQSHAHTEWVAGSDAEYALASVYSQAFNPDMKLENILTLTDKTSVVWDGIYHTGFGCYRSNFETVLGVMEVNFPSYNIETSIDRVMSEDGEMHSFNTWVKMQSDEYGNYVVAYCNFDSLSNPTITLKSRNMEIK